MADGEQVVLSTHPHWSRLAGPAMVVPATLLLAVVGVFLVPAWPVQDAIQYTIIVITLGLLVRFAVLPWLRWIMTRYIITTERLVVREGVLNRSRRDLPLLRIEDASIHSTPTERLFGSGTLAVSGAGQRGPLMLSSVPKVEDVYALLYQVADEAARRRYDG